MASLPRRFPSLLVQSAVALAASLPVAAQEPDENAAPLPAHELDQGRIWGRVHTADGEQYEGFVVWHGRDGPDGAGWMDFLEGDRIVAPEFYQAWLAATGGAPPVRAIEVKGHRVSWDEEDPDFSLASRAGVRFGRLAEVEALGDGHAALKLRGAGDGLEGPVVRIRRPAWTRGALTVFDRTAGERDVDWADLRRVEFFSPPAGATARARRLHGTVDDRFGRSFTGYVAWDSDEVLGSEVLDGEDEERKDREIRFDDIRRIEQRDDEARVELASGDELVLSGSNDVDWRNRGVRIFDSALGVVEVEWEEFDALRLEPPARSAAYGDSESAWPLAGTVATQDGDTLSGRLRWDAEHEWSWELLHGESRGVKFSIEFGQVARIERAVAGAVVTLADGRAFELEGSGDVDWDSRGVFVLPDGEPAGDPSAWRYLDWDEFREVRFVRGASDERRGGPGS